MDRVIKFRGKARELNKWVYGSYFNGLQWADFIIEDAGFENRVAVLSDTVGQFTGLLDKNGKEVYEGDIVKYIGNGLGDEFETEVKFEGAGFDPIATIYWMSDIEGVGCEIIGNIHDNPRIAERRLK